MLKLYNTLTRKKQIFRPLKDKKVGLYTCGPTVYDYAHIGNLRTYIFEDILRRTLEYDGYKVKQVMNITDIDDKIIKLSQKEKRGVFKITQPLTKIFFDDLKKLNIEKAEVYPLATKHIKEIIKLIQVLLKKGFAYAGKDKSIYFDISKFKNYGQLSGLKKRELKIGARIKADEYNKNQAQDFVLWKAKKLNEHSWPSPFGNGRPGWHIECSAMAMKYLGFAIDIHSGAVDLIFPHHENEIAQSEAATGKKFVNYWIEGEHLLINGKKMAKSLNNFYTLRDIENRNFDLLAFRYLVLNSHYRSKLNFTWESLKSAQNALNNLYDEVRQLNNNQPQKNQGQPIYEKNFSTAINDDLNMPKAVALIWQIIKDSQLSSSAKKHLLFKFDNILGLNLDKVKSLEIPLKIKQIADKRELFRHNKQFIQADALRKKIEGLGYRIEDKKYGPKITPSRHRS